MIYWIQQLGRRVEQVTMIADLEGMGPHFLWKPGLEYTKAVRLLSLPPLLTQLKIIMIVPIWNWLSDHNKPLGKDLKTLLSKQPKGCLLLYQALKLIEMFLS